MRNRHDNKRILWAPKIRCFLLGNSTCTAINKIANFSYTSKEARPMCTGARNVLWDKRGAVRDFRHSHKYNCIHSRKIFWLVNDRSSPTLFAWWFLALQEGWETLTLSVRNFSLTKTKTVFYYGCNSVCLYFRNVWNLCQLGHTTFCLSCTIVGMHFFVGMDFLSLYL